MQNLKLRKISNKCSPLALRVFAFVFVDEVVALVWEELEKMEDIHMLSRNSVTEEDVIRNQKEHLGRGPQCLLVWAMRKRHKQPWLYTYNKVLCSD